jgi:hypothetical protein
MPDPVEGATVAETRPRVVLGLLEAAGWRCCADGFSMRCPDCLGARAISYPPPASEARSGTWPLSRNTKTTRRTRP